MPDVDDFGAPPIQVVGASAAAVEATVAYLATVRSASRWSILVRVHLEHGAHPGVRRSRRATVERGCARPEPSKGAGEGEGESTNQGGDADDP